jgi:hypothetical protein
MFISPDNEGKMVLHMAANRFEIEVIQGMFKLSKNNLRRAEVKICD